MNSNQSPSEGSRWIHYNGIIYVVLLITNKHSANLKYPETVVYENENTGSKWSRRLDDWQRSMSILTNDESMSATPVAVDSDTTIMEND